METAHTVAYVFLDVFLGEVVYIRVERVKFQSFQVPLEDFTVLCEVHYHVQFIFFIVVNHFMKLSKVRMLQLLHNGYFSLHIL